MLRDDLNAAMGNLIKDEEAMDTTHAPVNTELQERCEKLENHVKQLEIISRENIMVVEGVKLEADRPLNDLVREQLNANLDLNIRPSEIVNCTFLGPRQENQQTGRAIHVKVGDMHLKKQIFKRKDKLEGSDMFVKEQLTAKMNSVFFPSQTRQEVWDLLLRINRQW